MAQAAQIIPFPSNKLTFKAIKIDVDKVIAGYDRNRPYVAIAVKFLTLTPAKLKQSVSRMQKDLKDEPVTRLIADFESLSKDYAAMSEMLDTAAARLTAGHRNLI